MMGMNVLDALRMEFGRRRDRPGRAPDQFNQHDAEVWVAGYVWAMNEAANVTARQKWDLEKEIRPPA